MNETLTDTVWNLQAKGLSTKEIAKKLDLPVEDIINALYGPSSSSIPYQTFSGSFDPSS